MIEDFKSKDCTLHLVYESTGKLSTHIHAWVRDFKVAQSMLNPAHVRYYAKALGSAAKTDKLDAKVLVLFAQMMHPKQDKAKSNLVLELKELYTHLDLLIANRARHKNELSEELTTSVEKSAQRMLKHYTEEIKRIQARIITLIKSDEELQERYDFYLDQHGIGERGAMTLVILMPELGYLNRNQVASLAGVAPFNCESGAMKGKRTIKGGRKRVRSILYLCVLSAIRKNGHLFEFYQNAGGRGKSKKGTIIACIRKLMIYLNSSIKKTKHEQRNSLIQKSTEKS